MPRIRNVISYSAQEVSSDQGVQEGRLTGLKERINAQTRKFLLIRRKNFSRVKRPANYTLLTPEQQGVFQNRRETVLSDTPNKESVNILFSQQLRLADDPPAVGRSLVWGTGAGKSYLIPALEIPAFVLMLNAIARLAYPDDIEDGKKIYSTTSSTAWAPPGSRPLGGRQRQLRRKSAEASIPGVHLPGFGAISRPQFLGIVSVYIFAGSFLWEMGGETTLAVNQ